MLSFHFHDKHNRSFHPGTVKSMPRLMSLVGVLVAIMFLGACGSPTPTPTSTSTSTSTPTPTPTLGPGEFMLPFTHMPTPTELQDSDTLQPKPILIFVIDRSESMNKCDSIEKISSISANIIYFFARLLDGKAQIKAVELPNKNGGQAIITTVSPDLSKKDVLAIVKPDNQTMSNNDYVSAFTAANNTFGTSEHFTVILFSDGAFNAPKHTRERGDVDDWLNDHPSFKENFYMLQWDCPKIYNLSDPVKERQYRDENNMWGNNLRERRLVIMGDDFDKVGDFLQKMVEQTELRIALPDSEYGRWWNGEGERLSLPGYTDELTAQVWVIQETEGETQSKLIIGSSEHKLPINPKLGQAEKIFFHGPKPDDGESGACAFPSYNLLLDDDTRPLLGYYVLKPHFVHADLKLKPGKLNTYDGLDFNKIEPAFWNIPDFTVNLTGYYDVEGGADTSKLKRYEECYSLFMEFFFNEKKISDIQLDFSTYWDNKQHLVDDEKIEQVSKSLDLPGDVFFVLSVYEKITNQVVSQWKSKTIPVRFYPQAQLPTPSTPETFKTATPVDIELDLGPYSDCKFYAENTKDDCVKRFKVYIYVSDIDKSEFCTTNTMQQAQDINILAYDKPIKVIEIVDMNTQKGNFDNSILKSYPGDSKIHLQLKNYEQVINHCGYQFVIIQWDEQTPAYACDLLNYSCKRADILFSEISK